MRQNKMGDDAAQSYQDGGDPLRILKSKKSKSRFLVKQEQITYKGGPVAGDSALINKSLPSGGVISGALNETPKKMTKKFFNSRANLHVGSNAATPNLFRRNEFTEDRHF